MDEKQRDSILYRFSGYQLNKLSLDETGHTYYILPSFIHPYYLNQPKYWETPVFRGGLGTTYGSGGSLSGGENESDNGSHDADCRSLSKEISQEEKLEAIKSHKNCKNRLFSLVKI
jgi:hypothetical protein